MVIIMVCAQTYFKYLQLSDYNFGNTIFLFSFLLAELPSQLVSKKMGPDRWIPLQITLWSIVAMCQCAIKGKSGFYATRSLLGLLEVCNLRRTTYKC